MAKKRKPPTVQKAPMEPRVSDPGTEELARHHMTEQVRNSDGRLMTIVMDQLVIDRMHVRGAIASEQWRAGDQLRRDFIYAGLAPRSTIVMGEIRGLSGIDSESRMDARRRYYEAMGMLPFVMQRVVRDVCCFGDDISDAARAAGCNRQEGSTRLKDGLEILAYHYGFMNRRMI